MDRANPYALEILINDHEAVPQELGQEIEQTGLADAALSLDEEQGHVGRGEDLAGQTLAEILAPYEDVTVSLWPERIPRPVHVGAREHKC
jgi:hypothetical protein